MSHSLFSIRTPAIAIANGTEPDTYLLFEGKGLGRFPTRQIALDILSTIQAGERSIKLRIRLKRWAIYTAITLTVGIILYLASL